MTKGEFLDKLCKRFNAVYDKINNNITKGGGSCFVDEKEIMRSELFNLLRFLGATYDYNSTYELVTIDNNDFTVYFDEFGIVDRVYENCTSATWNEEIKKYQPKTDDCECGATKIGASRHSYWCNKWKEF